MPRCKTHVRPLLALPKEERVECWKGIVFETPPDELTARQVAKIARQRVGDSDEVRTATARESAKARRTHALAALRRLELAVQELSRAGDIRPLLSRVERMIGESG